VSRCQKRTSGLYGAREDQQRQTHRPSGWAPLHRTKQCPPPLSSPYFFTGRMPFLPPNQQRQSTEGNIFFLAKLPIVNLQLLSTLSLSTVLLTFYVDSTYSSLTISWTTIVLVMWGAAELRLIGAIADVVWYDIWYDLILHSLLSSSGKGSCFFYPSCPAPEPVIPLSVIWCCYNSQIWKKYVVM